MNQPTDLINFTCNCCHTLLTVPQSMAGVSGPCPRCGETVTAPLPMLAPMMHDLPAPSVFPVQGTLPEPAPSNLPIPGANAPLLPVSEPSMAKPSGSRKWLFAGLSVAILGGVFALKQFHPESLNLSGGTPSPESTPAPVVSSDPKTQAIERSCSLAKKFLATSDWTIARSMVAAQDVPGTASDPGFQAEQFCRFSKSSKWTPLKVDEKENAGKFQIVWQVTDEGNSEHLLLTVDDTADGPKVRWYQPPYVVAAVGGTNGTPQKTTVTPPPAALPAAAPAATVTAEAAVLATTANSSLPSNGSSALLNRKIEKAADADSTASAAPAQ